MIAATVADPNQNNPYRSPSVPNELFHRNGSTVEAEHRGFRWRVIPVTTLYLCGGSLIFVSLLTTIHMVTWVAIYLHRGEYVRISWAGDVLHGSIVMVVMGTLLVFAGKVSWRRRWLHGVLGAMAALAVYCAFAPPSGQLLGL